MHFGLRRQSGSVDAALDETNPVPKSNDPDRKDHGYRSFLVVYSMSVALNYSATSLWPSFLRSVSLVFRTGSASTRAVSPLRYATALQNCRHEDDACTYRRKLARQKPVLSVSS